MAFNIPIPQRSDIPFSSENYCYTKIPGADKGIRFYFVNDERIIARPVRAVNEKNTGIQSSR